MIELLSCIKRFWTKGENVAQISAQAAYHLGTCYLKKGDKEQAIKSFQLCIQKYPANRAVAKKAESQLNVLNPVNEQMKNLPQKVLQHIVQAHFRAGEKASGLGIPNNTHIYGMDGFRKMSGGLIDVYNMGDDT